MAEGKGFEPLCGVARKLISSQPRYDHFDTSPYMLTRLPEINALFSCIRFRIRNPVASCQWICR